MPLGKLPEELLGKYERERQELLTCKRNNRRQKNSFPEQQAQRLIEVEAILCGHQEGVRTELKRLTFLNGLEEAHQYAFSDLLPPLFHEGAPTQKPPEFTVELMGDVEALKTTFRSIVTDACEGRWNRDQLITFLEQTHALNNTFDPDIPEGTPYQQLVSIGLAFNRHLCLPSGTVFFPRKLGYRVEPEFYAGQIHEETWRTFPALIGPPAVLAAVEWYEGGSAAYNVDQFAFVDPYYTFIDGKARYDEILHGPSNPFAQRLRPMISAMPPSRFIVELEMPRVIFEEVTHAHDRSFVGVYHDMLQWSHPNDAVAYAILSSQSSKLSEIWNQFHTRPQMQAVLLQTIWEYAGQLVSVIRHMEHYLQQSAPDKAYTAFLNYAVLWEDLRRIVLEHGGRIDPANTYSGYAVTGWRILTDIDLPDTSAAAILHHCETSTSHPAEAALQLLQNVCRKTLRSPEERNKLIDL